MRSGSIIAWKASKGAVLGIKLKHLNDWTRERQRVARRYTELLADTPLQLPHQPAFAESVWHLYVVRHPRRDELKKHLEANAVGCALHYPLPLHLQKCYAEPGLPRRGFPERRKGRTRMSEPADFSGIDRSANPAGGGRDQRFLSSSVIADKRPVSGKIPSCRRARDLPGVTLSLLVESRTVCVTFSVLSCYCDGAWRCRAVFRFRTVPISCCFIKSESSRAAERLG